MIADDATLAKESSDLLAHLIRNACVNDGTPESGFESRSTDVLNEGGEIVGVDVEAVRDPGTAMSGDPTPPGDGQHLLTPPQSMQTGEAQPL